MSMEYPAFSSALGSNISPSASGLTLEVTMAILMFQLYQSSLCIDVSLTRARPDKLSKSVRRVSSGNRLVLEPFRIESLSQDSVQCKSPALASEAFTLAGNRVGFSNNIDRENS